MTEMAAVSWAAAELGGAKLGDVRLSRRLVRVAERLGAQPGASIPVACGGWAETLGGKLLRAPEDIPDIGRFCVLQDPQGATLCAITYRQP